LITKQRVNNAATPSVQDFRIENVFQQDTDFLEGLFHRGCQEVVGIEFGYRYDRDELPRQNLLNQKFE